MIRNNAYRITYIEPLVKSLLASRPRHLTVMRTPCSRTLPRYRSWFRLWKYPVEIWSRFVKTPLVDDTDRQRIAVQELLDRIIDILLASGIETPQYDLREEVELSYADTLRQVIRQSLEFQRITGERIISRDLFIITVAPEDPFDPSRMVDVWDKSKRARHPIDPHPVLCTTQLGLVREEKKAAEGAGDKEAVAAVVLLKPKVVLTSLLKELPSPAKFARTDQDRQAASAGVLKV